MGKKVIIIGAGYSVKQGIDLGLWDKIKSLEKWSLNSVFRAMPYLPEKELFVDADFLQNNINYVKNLQEQGVEIVCKKIVNRLKMIYLQKLLNVTQYEATQETNQYFGKKSIENNIMYYGYMGLCGAFALNVAIARGYDEIFLLGYDFGTNSINNTLTHFYQENFKIYADCINPVELPGNKEDWLYSAGAGRPIVYRSKDNEVYEQVNDFTIFSQEQGIKIYNVSPNSNIECFEKINYNEFFEIIK